MRLDDRALLKGHGKLITRFSEKMIVQTKGRWAGQPLTFEPWQRDFLDELFLVYDDGERVYREALLGVARKQGKSTMAAAIALFLLIGSDESGPEVYAAAASKDQARVVFNQAREFVESSPRLRDWLVPRKDAITCRANQGVFRVLASDASTQYGLNPSGVVIDELWAHKDPELYYALTTGQGARVNPLVVSITTAGWDRASICYELYERGLRLQEEGGLEAMREASFLFKWFEAPSTASVMDPEGWEAANPSSWIRAADLRREAKRLPESVFRRLHLNQFTESQDAWIKPHQWAACRGTPILDPKKESYIAVDVGVRRDSAALVWAQWHDDRLHVGQRILLPEEEGPTFGVADIRGELAGLVARNGKVREVPYDPWQFRESAEILLERGVPMVEFPQSAGRLAPASENLYELIVEGRVVHDGSYQAKAQMLATVASPTDRGGWQISKRKSLERIDFSVSLAMVADRAVTLRNVKVRRGAAFL